MIISRCEYPDGAAAVGRFLALIGNILVLRILYARRDNNAVEAFVGYCVNKMLCENAAVI